MRYESVTTVRCAACAAAIEARGRRRFCSNACRQRAYRQRAGETDSAISSRPALANIYECGSCGSRYLGEQRCPDCNTFCRRLGPGGLCPHCDEPIPLTELF